MFNKNSKMGKNVRAARRLAAILMAGTLTGAIAAGSAPAVIVSAATWQENADYIFDYLTKRLKYSEAAACGIMANIRCESTFNPHAWNAGGGSYGLCQWTGGRYGRLQSWCGSNGYDYTTIDGQLAYLEYELQSFYPGVENYLRSVENTRDGAYNAGQYYCYHFAAPASRASVSVYRGGLASGTYWDSYRPAEWYLVDGTWRYVLRDGSYHKGWLTLDKQTFYLDKDGRRVSGWNTIDGKRYYFDEKGVIVTGWYKVDGRNYYFAKDGSLVTGVVRGNDELYPVDNYGGIQGVAAMEKYAPEWIARDEERQAEIASAEAGDNKEAVSDIKDGNESALAQAETDEKIYAQAGTDEKISAQAEEGETTPAENTDEDIHILAAGRDEPSSEGTSENLNPAGSISASVSDGDKQLAALEKDGNESLASAKKNEPKANPETDSSAKSTAALQDQQNPKTTEEEEQFNLAAEAMRAAAENMNEDSAEEPEAQVFAAPLDQEEETTPESAAEVDDQKDDGKAETIEADNGTQDGGEKEDTPEASVKIATGITAPFASAETGDATEKSDPDAVKNLPFGLPGMTSNAAAKGNDSKGNSNAPVYSLPFSYADASNMLSKEFNNENEKESSDAEAEPADSVTRDNNQGVPFAGESSETIRAGASEESEKADTNKAESDEKNDESEGGDHSGDDRAEDEKDQAVKSTGDEETEGRNESEDNKSEDPEKQKDIKQDEAASESATEESSEAASESATEEPETASESATEEPEAASESATEESSEAASESATEESEAASESATEESSEAASESATEEPETETEAESEEDETGSEEKSEDSKTGSEEKSDDKKNSSEEKTDQDEAEGNGESETESDQEAEERVDREEADEEEKSESESDSESDNESESESNSESQSGKTDVDQDKEEKTDNEADSDSSEDSEDEEIRIILKKDIPDISRDEMDDLVEILRKKNILHAVSGNGLNITPKVKASFEQDEGDTYTVTFSVEYNGSEAELESSVRITD